MKIQRIYPIDYPKNKKILFQYKSNFYYNIIKKEKEKESGLSFELIKTPFRQEFVKSIEELLFDQYKENTEYFILLNDHEVEIGQLSVGHQKFNNRARIWDIYIDEAFQRKGLGTKLIQFAEERAREWKCRSLVLETQTSNFKAIKFYEKNGFSITGFDLNFYSNADIKNQEVRLEMSKILA